MYFLLAACSFGITFVVTPLVRYIMRKYSIVDIPKESRKIHQKPIALGGGFALYLAFFFVLYFFYKVVPEFPHLPGAQIWWLFFGATVLMIGGFIDDKYTLKARYQIIFPSIAALLMVFAGLGPQVISNPFGGVIQVDTLKITNWLHVVDIGVFFWLLMMMYATKLMDGLDGLVTGIVGIGSLVIFFLTLQDLWYQPDVSAIAIVLFGVCLGFLMWNYHPATIFLGEGGSLLLGFLLGALAIISGSKIATALLVMAVPVFDIVVVLLKRFMYKQPLFKADNEHIHHHLLGRGLTHVQAVWTLWIIAFVFGMSTLFLDGLQKLIILIILFCVMMMVGVFFSTKKRQYE